MNIESNHHRRLAFVKFLFIVLYGFALLSHNISHASETTKHDAMQHESTESICAVCVAFVFVTGTLFSLYTWLAFPLAMQQVGFSSNSACALFLKHLKNQTPRGPPLLALLF